MDSEEIETVIGKLPDRRAGSGREVANRLQGLPYGVTTYDQEGGCWAFALGTYPEHVFYYDGSGWAYFQSYRVPGQSVFEERPTLADYLRSLE